MVCLVVTATIVIYDYSAYTVDRTDASASSPRRSPLLGSCMYGTRDRADMGECICASSLRPAWRVAETPSQKKRWSVIKLAFLWVRSIRHHPRTSTYITSLMAASIFRGGMCSVSSSPHVSRRPSDQTFILTVLYPFGRLADSRHTVSFCGVLTCER